MKSKQFLSVVLLATSFALTIPLCLAQSAGTGALTGTVKDSTGGVIPGVSVTATNIETGLERSALTSETGSYSFTLLPPGNYRVKFSAGGFKTSEVPSVTVSVTETPVLNRVLDVGAQSEVVEVQAQAEVLQTANSTLGTTVSNEGINALPLTSRNFTQILSLSAGAAVAVNNGAAFGKGTQDMSVNGARPEQNNFHMDGVAVNNSSGQNSSGDSGLYTGIPIPNPDAIQEFKIQTSTYDASYGRNPGANVDVVTKSGTNELHGTAFEFFRNQALNANDFFQNRDNHDGPNGTAAKQVLNQNQFGGTLGGPILKDKAFLFGSYQGTRQINGVAAQGTTTATLPPIPAGDRSAPGFQAALGAAMCPQNHPGDPGYTTLFSFAGSMQVACDGSNINPVAMNLLRVKLPDGSYYIPGSTNGSFQQKQYSAPARYREDQFIGNFDWLATAKNTVAIHYLNSRNPQQFSLNGQLPGRTQDNLYATTTGLVKLTTLVTNTFVNEARVSAQRIVQTGNDSIPYSPQSIGLNPIIPTETQPPLMLILGAFNIGSGLNPSNSPTNQFQAADQISWTRGKHTMRAGFELEKIQWNLTFGALERGFLIIGSFPDLLIGRSGCTFAGCSPDNPGNTNGSPFGNILSCLFCVRSGPNGIIHGYRQRNLSAFYQDDFKLNSRLTLNLGVRWEYDGVLGDIYGNLTNVWPSELAKVPIPPSTKTATGDSLVGYVVPSNFPSHYGTPPAGVRLLNNEFPSKNGVPLTNFGPRFGFAWQPRETARLVVRGGAGVFYDRIGGDKFVHAVEQGNPYADTLDYGGPGATPFSLQDPFPQRPLAFTPRFFDLTTGATSNLNTPFYETIHTPLIRQYNLNVQYEFMPQWVLEVGYVGSSGINLADYNHNVNTAHFATPSNPVHGLTTTTATNVNSRTPYLGYQPAGLQGTTFDAVHNYNSLQATVRKQFSKGFSLQTAYTWSKNLTNIVGALPIATTRTISISKSGRPSSAGLTGWSPATRGTCLWEIQREC